MQANFPTVRKRGSSILVDCGTVFGNRRRKQFRCPADAEAYAAECRRELKLRMEIERTQLRTRVVNIANLDDRQRADVLTALQLLDGHATLSDAARHFVKTHPTMAHGADMRQLMRDYIEEKRTGSRRPRTIQNAHQFLRHFVDEYADRPAASITTDDVTRWLRGHGYRQRTFNTYRRALDGLFRYAVRMRIITFNPVEPIPPAAVDETDVTVLTCEQAQVLLKAARDHAPDMVPYFAVGLFAGLRPMNELAQLQAQDIDMERGHILVKPATAKKRRARYVKIEGNLRQWLTSHPVDGQVFFSRSQFRRVVIRSGLTWSPDIMRHSYASHHLAAYENAPATSAQLGHSSGSDMLFHHYRALVDRSAGLSWFALVP